mgnify:FL=1
MPRHPSAATLMQENNRGGPAAVGRVMTLFRLPSVPQKIRTLLIVPPTLLVAYLERPHPAAERNDNS